MTVRIVAPIQVLLVEDNPVDVRLTQEATRDAKVSNEIQDGREVLLDKFIEVVRSIEDFWLTIVWLPPRAR